MKSILIWSGAGVLIVGGLLALFTFVDPQAPAFVPEGSSKLLVPVDETDHVKGNAQAAVVLVEYGDFQCPACKSYVPIISQLEQEFGDRVAFVYRHYPLPIHANAQNAARAAEAASMQGMFWEMHDILFDKQGDWATERNVEDTFVEYALSLGVHAEQFRSDFNSGSIKDKVKNSLTAANAAGLTQTPSFFLNGDKLRNPRSYDEFKRVITSALSQQGGGEQHSEIEQSSELMEQEEGSDQPVEEGDDPSIQEGS
jgi:protein-disulfide isomerase